ncbi:M14 family zinc carboxypeptidase [Aquipuribacter sp. SD81]|uniref:M14 family zinc carboxypeptidase n=1 Tax=Aquipuribacter sp. SD81 TaxID=3127703 RepID=UPI0030179267
MRRARAATAGLGLALTLGLVAATGSPATAADPLDVDDLDRATDRAASAAEQALDQAPQRALERAPGLGAGSSTSDAVAEDLPLTGFEASGGATWTTLEEEYAFLEEVAARSERVRLEQVATTAQGRPLTLVTVTDGEERSVEEIASGASALVLCLQHGNEPAAREGCLQGLRDLAFSDDPADLRMLERSTVLFVPTVNPDGRAANTRANSEGIDINRDHIALESAEARAVAELTRDLDPEILHDAHEYGGNRTFYNRDFIHLWPRNLNVDDKVYGLARSLVLDYVDVAVVEGGYTTGEYGIYYDPETGEPVRQVAGDQDERILRNATGLRHTAGLLVESLVNDFDGVGPVANNLRRVDTQVLGIEGTLDMLARDGSLLVAQTRAAERRAVAEGLSGNAVVYFDGADNTEPTQVVEAPCAYVLTDEQHADLADTLALHDIAVTDGTDGWTVSMAQPAKTVIPLLLDERARFELVAATPVDCR